jgi:hypothetical protein
VSPAAARHQQLQQGLTGGWTAACAAGEATPAGAAVWPAPRVDPRLKPHVVRVVQGQYRPVRAGGFCAAVRCGVHLLSTHRDMVADEHSGCI